MGRTVTVGCLLAFFAATCAWADYPTQDIISLNISNDSAYKMEGSGETETLAGTLPDNAWQNTSNADRTGVVHSGDARNGYRNGVTAWDGTSQSVTTLDDVVFSWAVEGSNTANYGNLSSREPVFRRAWLARASGASEFTSVVVQNIPYEKYDVIVYVSGNASATDVRAVLINGVPYKGDTGGYENNTRAASSNTSTWGNVGSDTLALGGNALRVNGLASPDLQVSMKNATTWGICAIQIVRDMSAGIGNAQRATGKVISVNLQSAKNTSGYTTGDIGIVRVPAEAWTADGLALADSNANYDSDVDVAIKEWDGATGTTSELTGITLHEKVKNAYYYGASSYVPQPQVLSSYADDYDGSSWRGTITVTGVPYKKYDVIVYCATDTENKYFGPVSVNGTPYRWSESNKTTQEASSADSSDSTHWGFSQSRVMAYGGNALRITDQTSSTLVIKGANNANSCRGGIAGFQIVDTYDPSAIPSVTIEDGGRLELSAAQETALRVICEGSLTVVGVNDYIVTNADLLKLDFDDVTGTVTLGASTCYALGSSRTIPSGYLFGEGSAVAVTETAEEYAKDAFSVSGLTGVSTVVLTRYDGTTANLTVTNGEASRGDGTDVHVTGAAALYDFTFTNTVHTAEGSRNSTALSIDGGYSADYKTSETDGTGLNAWTGPWINLASTLPTWAEFSTVVVGQMPTAAKKMFVSFGSTASGGKMLYLATGAKENEVIVGYTGQSEPIATMTVPNASRSRHVYAFVIANNRKDLYIYLDGMFWKKGSSESGFSFGTTSHGGIQVGSGFGGNPSGYGRPAQDDTGVFYSLLIYDYILSNRQIEALKDLYPYSPSAGSYSRDVSGATTFATDGNTWIKAGDDTANYTVPANGSAITLTAGPDATIAVNATLSADSLSLGGDGALTLAKGDGLLTSAGLTTIATDVTIEGGAADISGAPTVITESGSLCFNYSAYDVFSFTGTSLIPLTGEIEEQAADVVTCQVPTGAFAREHTVEFLYTNGCYQLLVTCREGREVYLPAGTTRFEDGTPVKYFVEVPADPEASGDPEIVTNECYAIYLDTVHFLDADTVAVERANPVAGYDFGDYAGTLVFAPGQEELVLNTAITGAGKVEVSSGAVQSRGSIATDIDVDAGAVLKLGSVGGFGATGGGTTPSGKTITVAGTVELNGVVDSCNEFTLNGGTLRNTGAAIPTNKRQTTALTLTANSTVHAGSDFGLVSNGYAATSLELGGYTLAKTGDASFWLYNTRSTGAGIVDVQAGAVYAYSTVSMPNVGFNIAEGATLKVRTDDFSVGTISGVGTINFGQNRPTTALNFADGSSLDVKIVLASTTEANVRIPYTGAAPHSVTVYEPSGDWDEESTAATVTYEDGNIVVTVDVANARRDNPALDGDGATFRYAFRGDVDGTWEKAGNWYDASGNRWSAYTGSGDLGPNFTNEYESVLFDGDLMDNIVPDAEGYRNVTVSTRMEGWALRVGLFNHVKVSSISVKKQQGNCWYMVDATSKLVMSDNNKAGNNGGKVTFYVAAKDGVEFTGDFDFGGTSGVEYYFKGEGSVNYTAGNTHGAHTIKAVSALPLGKMSPVKHIFRRKLVSFGGNSTKTYVTADATVAGFKVNKAGNEEPVTMTVKRAEEASATLEVGTDPVGTCVFVQDSTGVYIDYVGYGVPLSIRIR